ncbi:unnamed protein product [Fructobacillus tropaeoli]|uniref:hypothetical protein n=1 Tax=Fructobacillus tropaeoli TaxID=709323 RepID=UPI001436D2DE|nr:MAG: hypothetical protein [Caudoviricetes sp.]CAK1254676.1 unnamed protein product [Fructobacillus tropaeoli]
MLTKNAELLLKKFINNEFDSFDSSNIHISEGEIFRNSPLPDDSKTEIALAELLNNGYLSKIANALYYPTTAGKTYFDLMKINNKHEWKSGFLMPLLSGFTSGVLVTLLTTWLLGLLKFQS